MGSADKPTVFTFDTVGSTNSRAFELAASSTTPFWVVADRQSEGRGRRGRHWVSEPGNLYASCYLAEPADPGHLHELPFVATAALYAAIATLLSGLELQLAIKWPNDLTYGGAKVSGILIESRTGTDGRNGVVIGFGVNCRHHPQIDDYPTTDLSEITGRALEPMAMFEALSSALTDRLSLWARGSGFSAIRQYWLQHAHPPGTDMAVTLPEGRITGRFDGVDGGGRLILRTDDGQQRIISAGDVAIMKV